MPNLAMLMRCWLEHDGRRLQSGIDLRELQRMSLTALDMLHSHFIMRFCAVSIRTHYNRNVSVGFLPWTASVNSRNLIFSDCLSSITLLYTNAVGSEIETAEDWKQVTRTRPKLSAKQITRKFSKRLKTVHCQSYYMCFNFSLRPSMFHWVC